MIQSTIVNDLLEADLVIADLTDHNPNVLFELGVRIAEDKPVVLVKASGTGRIFDVDNMMRVYEYSANLWQSTVEKDLAEITEHIKAAWEKRGSDQSDMKISGEAECRRRCRPPFIFMRLDNLTPCPSFRSPKFVNQVPQPAEVVRNSEFQMH